jgi:hypothetical protein
MSISTSPDARPQDGVAGFQREQVGPLGHVEGESRRGGRSDACPETDSCQTEEKKGWAFFTACLIRVGIGGGAPYDWKGFYQAKEWLAADYSPAPGAVFQEGSN